MTTQKVDLIWDEESWYYSMLFNAQLHDLTLPCFYGQAQPLLVSTKVLATIHLCFDLQMAVALSKPPWVKVDMQIHILLPLLLLCYGGVASIHCSRVHESSQDLRALLHFKQGVTSDPYGALSNWNISSHFCRWNFVNCTSAKPYRVSGLILYNQSLSGQISSSLGNLTFLNYFDLSQNNFVGSLPLLGCLQQLQLLYLNKNSLSGIIPDAFSNSSNFIALDLSSNLLLTIRTSFM
jgi:hypothetical protein